MAAIKSFEELEYWQDARVFVSCVYGLLKKNDFKSDYDLLSQVRRSAISVLANIAEGFHRHSNKDFTKFLSSSRASLAETISHFYIALDQGYIVESERADVQSQSELVGKKVNGLISYLNKKEV